MMWRCLVIVVAVTSWNLLVPVLTVPQGENTCQGVVKHPVKVKVNVTEPVTFRTYTWCLRVPPRCSKYVVQMKERVKEQVEMHNRTITVCCRGFVEMESKCVPACPPMTECPNMHCNRTNHCYCSPGYSGVFCNDPCPKGSWGRDCKKPCDCPDGFTCHHLTGDCMLDDKPSVKTTVRRAFTHESESIPTTLNPITTTSRLLPLYSLPVTTGLTTATPSTTTAHSATTSTTSKFTTYPPLPSTTILPTTTTTTTVSPPTTMTTILPPTTTTTTTIPTTTTVPPTTTTSTTVSPTTTKTTTVPPTTTTTTTVPPPTTTSLTNSVPTTTTTTVPPPTTITVPQFTSTTTPVPPSPIPTPHTTSTPSSTTTTTSTVIPTTVKTTLFNAIVIPTQDSPSTVSTTEIPKIWTPQIISRSSVIPSFPYLNPFSSTSTTSFPNLMKPTTQTSKVDETTDILVKPFPELITVPLLKNQEAVSGPILEQNAISTTLNLLDIPKIFALPTDNVNEEKNSTTERMHYNQFYNIFKATTIRPYPIKHPSSDLANERVYQSSLQGTTFKPSYFPDLLIIPHRGKPPGEENETTVFNYASTESNNAPEIPMQTPNRNLKPFIPSPGTTQSHGSLTIPLSGNFPITELYSVKSSTKILPNKPFDTNMAGVIETTTEQAEERLSTHKSYRPKIQKPNTFLHSFLKPTLEPNAPEKEILVQPSSPTFHLKPGTSQTFTEYIHNVRNDHSSLKPFTPPTHQTIESSDINPSVIPLWIQHYFNTTGPNMFPPKRGRPEAYGILRSFPSNNPVTTPLPGSDISSAPADYIETVDDQVLQRKDYSLSSNPILQKQNHFNTKDVLTSSGNGFVNILNKNQFISAEKPDLNDKEELMTTNKILDSTYSYKTVPLNINEKIKEILGVELAPSQPHYSIPVHVNLAQTTPMTPITKESHINGKKLEEPSNYLPTLFDKMTTPLKSPISKGDVHPTSHHIITEAPSAYLPTDKDFLNLTFILNSINDFTSNSKRGMKHKSLLYGTDKGKYAEDTLQNDLVTNIIHDEKMSTQIRPLSTYSTEKDSKIIKLNFSSPFSFDTSAEFSQSNTSPYNPASHFTKPIDGRITTVSILSTVPLLKYPTKRSTKDNLEKTENAFTLSYQRGSDVQESVESVQRNSNTNVTPLFIPSVQINKSDLNSEEVSKKPFRRKDTEDFVRSNMTAALSAHSAVEEESPINLTTGILATITCVLMIGSLASLTVLFFVYCRKEKPVAMESCIMAYGQATTEPTPIYSVPRPSLLPEIFFCPTFSHDYAAQINKELQELSNGAATKGEKIEPVYNEISN